MALRLHNFLNSNQTRACIFALLDFIIFLRVQCFPDLVRESTMPSLSFWVILGHFPLLSWHFGFECAFECFLLFMLQFLFFSVSVFFIKYLNIKCLFITKFMLVFFTMSISCYVFVSEFLNVLLYRRPQWK